MLIRKSEFLKSTGDPENSRCVWNNSTGRCNPLLILVLGFVCGVLVSQDTGVKIYHEVDFTWASHHNVPMRDHP